MPEWLPWMTLVPTGLLAFVWMTDRRRASRKFREFSSQQIETTRVLNEFIEESGKITQEFARLLSQVPAPSSFAPTIKDRVVNEPKRRGVEKRHLVLHLAQ